MSIPNQPSHSKSAIRYLKSAINMIGCLSGLFGVTFPNHPINRHMIANNASMKLGLIMFQEFYSDSAWVRCWWWPPVLWCSPNSAFYRDWLSWIHLSFYFGLFARTWTWHLENLNQCYIASRSDWLLSSVSSTHGWLIIGSVEILLPQFYWIKEYLTNMTNILLPS